MMWRDKRSVTSRGDYILGSDLREFYNTSVRETRVPKDHGIILAEIRVCGT